MSESTDTPITPFEWSARLAQLQAQLTAATARAESAEKERDQFKGNGIALNAWQHSFGTTQLTHAIARLEAAEKANDQLTTLSAERDSLEKELAKANGQLSEINGLLKPLRGGSPNWKEWLSKMDADRLPAEPPASIVRLACCVLCSTTLDLVEQCESLGKSEQERASLLETNQRLREESKKNRERLEWLHKGGERDLEGFEWGIFRVKWSQRGQPLGVRATFSDFSDLDAEMAREAALSSGQPQQPGTEGAS